MDVNRIPIRDNSSEKEIKPRFLDVVVRENGHTEVEVKGNGTRSMRLDDFMSQMKIAIKKLTA